LTDADASLRRLFVPAAQAADPGLEVEAREHTPGGFVVSTGLRRVSVIERMERVGAITHRQGCAARQIYRDYAVGIMGARDRDAAVGNGSPGGYTDTQIDAATRYRMVKDRLGPRLFPLVHAAVLADVSVPDYARVRGLNRASMTQVLRIALDMAGDILGVHE
jgi:hypothetical protein